IPSTGWSAQDSAALAGLGWRDKIPFDRQELRHVREEFERIRDDKSEPSIVVYLSARAVSGYEGDVAVLAADSKLDQRDSWLSLRDVLKQLGACGAKHKLLILDIVQPFVAPRSGVVADDVSARAEVLVKKATEEHKGFLVLSACAASQNALTSEDLGHSVFAYYLEQGLRGAADGYNESQQRNGEVSVRELHAFVLARVSRWAQNNRALPQTPTLFGSADEDFALLAAGSPRPAEERDEASEATYPSWLQKDWQWLEDWRASSRFRVPANTYRRLDEELIRAEHQLRAGKSPNEITGILRRPAERFEQKRNELVKTARQLQPRSLAEAIAQGQVPPDIDAGEAREKLREFAIFDARPQAAKGEKEVAKFEADRKEFLKNYDKRYFELAWTVFQTAAEEPRPVAQHLRTWNDIVGRASSPLPSDKRPHYAELDFLDELAERSAKMKEGSLAGETLNLALVAAREAASAQAVEPENLAWVTDLLEQATGARDEANESLLGKDEGRRANAAFQYEKANRLYSELQAAVKRLREARARVEEAIVLLPATLRTLSENRVALADVKDAVQLVRKLRTLLAGQPKGSAREEAMTEMEEKTHKLNARLHDSLAPLLSADRWKELTDPRATQQTAACRDIERILDRSWLSAKDRTTLWSAGHALAATLNEKTLKADAEDDKHGRTKAPGNLPAGRDSERGLAALRAGLAIELLSVESGGDVRELEARLKSAENQQLETKSWDDLRKALSQA
ncbi:MAG TPA: hypothetical protein VKE94_12200, partial [Gemmataceae bacterium]|nr:hypothetical protein [Gemmataceae bacterium]